VGTARVAALSALLASLLAGPGCFKPTFHDRAFFCADGGVCPGGLKCDKRHNPPLCVSEFDGGAGMGGKGGKGGAGGEAGHFDAGVDAQDAIDAPCVGPVSQGCVAPADAAVGMCDPVCNTGCGQCYQKCSVSPAGDLTCNTPYNPSIPPLGVLAGPCQTSQFSGDPSTQTDNCQPGTVCIQHNVCGPRCYQFCRKDTDCQPNASCGIDAGGGNMLCDVPTVTCDPVAGAADQVGSSGCPGTVQTCYLSSDTGHTTCDCYTSPGLMHGASCVHARDCYPGLTCTDPYGNMGKKCYKVCRLPSDGGTANPNESSCAVAKCTPIVLSKTGALTATYGVCPE